MWNGTAWKGETVLDDSTAFNSVKTKWAYGLDNDSGGLTRGLYSYYFDGNDALTDTSGTWTNDTNVNDADEDTVATSTGVAPGLSLLIEGTTYSSGNSLTIKSVHARVKASRSGSPQTLRLRIYTDGQGEQLLNF